MVLIATGDCLLIVRFSDKGSQGDRAHLDELHLLRLNQMTQLHSSLCTHTSVDSNRGISMATKPTTCCLASRDQQSNDWDV